jgi:hypothetical protein
MNRCTIQERTLIPLIRGERGPFGRACRYGEQTGEAGGADKYMIAKLDPFITLRLGHVESLRVKENGTIMNGNHRVRDLEERGVNINQLPREARERKI